MPQLHKGDRLMVFPRMPAHLRAWAHDEASRAEVSVSAWIADVMALAVGRCDLVREVDVPELPAVDLVVPSTRYELLDSHQPSTTVRLLRPVTIEIRRRAVEVAPEAAQLTPMTTYVTCTLAAAMHAPLYGAISSDAAVRAHPKRPVQEALLAV
ncbi:hypothetical protein [Mycobacterium avium]|uniref:hypothetical protein n=1 Tax=Mycobacterium avium TaxID=1764 RepID=UPI000BAF764B|nr:hypothetical protein [Mycobacterium avium]PBA08462.1 hypothetical protein CKJ70_26160 [Mycobacterium avium]